MEVNDQNLQALAHYLQQTLSPDQAIRKEAEAFLRTVENQQGYPLLLMHAMEQPALDHAIRHSAAVTFKNLIRRQWALEGDADCALHAIDRAAIKAQIIELMTRLPEAMQRQISDAIAIIGKVDFPHNWPELLPVMVAKFESGDFHMINGILRTAHPLFRRYRYEERSDNLWTEINMVLTQFAAPLTQLLKATVSLIEPNAGNADWLKIIFNSLLLISKLFYSLNSQDLPAFFEENMQIWMETFHNLICLPPNPLLDEDDAEKPGVLELLKSQICENIALYASKYDEEFQPFLGMFVTDVWGVLTATSNLPRYDQLVSTSMGFLASVAQRETNKGLFDDPALLSSICEKVVVPNVVFRRTDEEMFHDDPEEYIRRDIEGSDIDTRRRGACDLVRALCTFFEHQVTEIFSHYIAAMLQEYAADPKHKWQSKNAAIFLVTSLAVKGQTKDLGTTKTSDLINVVDFYGSNVLPDLQSPELQAFPVLKADAIKYVLTFRNQLPKEVHDQTIPLLIRHLSSASIVVTTYAAGCLERVLVLRQGGVPIVSEGDLGALMEGLLTGLFGALERPGNNENEYVMKAIMRTISCGKGTLAPYVMIIVSKLGAVLTEVAKNPSRPRFNHYLFEALGGAIRYTCAADPAAVESFEGQLFPIFTQLLTQDVVEFQPYVFQLLAQMLESRPEGVPAPYLDLFAHLTMPVLWQSGANTTPLVRLLQAYIRNGGAALFAHEGSLTALLGVFQKLIASKTNDHEGFNLVDTLIERLPLEMMEPYIRTILTLLFQRLQGSKTVKFMKGLLVFMCLVVGKYSGDYLVSTIDGIQPQLFAMVLNRLLEDVQKVTGDVEKKICAVGMVKLLCNTPAMLASYAHLWCRLLSTLIATFELPEDERGLPDEEADFGVDFDDQGYQAVFAKLAFSGRPEVDPFKEIADAKVFLATELHGLASRQPGQLIPRMQAELQPEVFAHLQQYLQAAGVGILP